MDDIVLQPLEMLRAGSWNDHWSFIQQTGSRQVSFASFAAQAKWLGADPLISRAVNVLLHLFNGVLAYGVFLRIACRARIDQGQLFACIATLIWVLNPTHATTLLYPIQRMTLLGGTGSLVIFYLGLGRHSRLTISAIALVYPLAILAKENAILALPALFALRAMTSPSPRVRGVAYMAIGGGAAAVVLGSLWMAPALEIPLRYAAWDFTLPERLALAPGALLRHAAMFVAPTPLNFSFYYDDYFLPDRDRLRLLDFFIVCALPATLFALYRLSYWAPITASGIALFGLLHSVEGSVLALDLFFEHRNYLPSLGLAAAIAELLTRVRRIDHRAAVAIALTLATYFGGCLAYRSYVIGDETRLAAHHLDRHPLSFRAATDAALYAPELRPSPTRNTPFQIEVDAINLLRACGATANTHPLPPSGKESVPQRSIRLHEAALIACSHVPCKVDPAYVHRLASAYLVESRVDSYRRRIEPLLNYFNQQHASRSCDRSMDGPSTSVVPLVW